MQNKSVTLPINNNRHSTRTWEEINKKEKLHRHHSHSMGKHKNRLSSIIYCLLSIATSLLPSECCWNVCVCVCAACFRFLFQHFSLFFPYPKLCCAGLLCLYFSSWPELWGNFYFVSPLFARVDGCCVCVRSNRFRPGQNLSKEKTNRGGGV